MKRSLFAVGAVVGVGAMLALAAPAHAHVVVSPEEVTAGEYETLTVSVPTEKEVPTTEIRVEVPEGFLLSGVQPVPGWEHAFEEDRGVVTAVTFSGGEIRPREFQQFLVQAQAPEEPGGYPWKATQTYEDGSTVEWTGAPDSEEPASVVEVVYGGSADAGASPEPSEASASSASQQAGGEAGVLADTGGTSPVVYAVVGVAGLLASALLARRLLG
jgi:LPXTG-motif cell wall-anchored protein